MLSSFHAIQESFSRRRYKEIAPVLKDDVLEINDGIVWPSSVCSDAPVVASQSRTVWSPEADASRVPSVEKATDVTQAVWPSSVCSDAPVVASQSRTVWSPEADASRVPSVEKATDVTLAVWPSSVCKHALQLLFIIGFVIIQPGSSSLNSSLVKLHVGLNIRADAYA
jgi:hypothetical protein